jgi:hypothetical protein
MTPSAPLGTGASRGTTADFTRSAEERPARAVANASHAYAKGLALPEFALEEALARGRAVAPVRRTRRHGERVPGQTYVALPTS